MRVNAVRCVRTNGTVQYERFDPAILPYSIASAPAGTRIARGDGERDDRRGRRCVAFFCDCRSAGIYACFASDTNNARSEHEPVRRRSDICVVASDHTGIIHSAVRYELDATDDD